MNTIVKQKSFMNTVITIKVVQDEEFTTDILDSIEEAYGEFDRIVKQYTRFNDQSELSDLNRHSGKWFKVNPEFFDLVKYMLNLAEITNGAFDPTIIDFLEVYGYDKNYDFSKLDNPALDSLVQKIADTRHSFREIEMDEDNKKIKLAKGQRIDLGGVGKGYAIDCAFSKLDWLNNFVIDAGGDLRAKGRNDKQELWTAQLITEDKDRKIQTVGYVKLNDEALACSGSWGRRVKQFHHLINPATGKPQNETFKTVYVQAPTGMDSDSWATALFIGGEDVTSKMPENMKYFTVKE